MSNAISRQGGSRSPQVLPSGVIVPEILFPSESVDLYRWAVIACDQHTARPDYWEETARLVGDVPSTLNLILPEYYLEHPDGVPIRERIEAINDAMRRYLSQGILRPLGPGCILTDRQTPEHQSRSGLLLAIDLDCYDYAPGNRNLIRATEGTVVERIPPRAAIRQDAPLELPHAQVLIDDPQHRVIEPLAEAVRTAKMKPLYRTELMQRGGSISGWFFPAGSPELQNALLALGKLNSLRQYGLMMAVGDGNHSLATAKAHWAKNRQSLPADHPARYALVEVINLHDDGLSFEPIHRVLAGISLELLIREAVSWFSDQAPEFVPAGNTGAPGTVTVPVLSRDRQLDLVIGKPRTTLPAGLLQPFLDHLSGKAGVRIDYIHGSDEVRRLAASGQIGLLLPAMSKQDLFPGLARNGVLPRKTFSMGEAHEKRYYLECRSIR